MFRNTSTIAINGYSVRNVPDNYIEFGFMVFRIVDDSAWFYGCWNSEQDALRVAEEVGGVYAPIQ